MFLLQAVWAHTQQKRTRLGNWHRIGWLWIGLVSCGCLWVGCPNPSWLETLRPPQGSARLRVRWMRTTFYQAYLEEKRQLDGEDRLRRLIQKFPQIALETYQYNQKAVEDRRLTGQPLRNLETFYLLMNQLIRETIRVPESLPPLSD